MLKPGETMREGSWKIVGTIWRLFIQRGVLKNKATGLGWNEDTQIIISDEEQWAELIKIHKPIKAFRKGPPDNLELMHIMSNVNFILLILDTPNQTGYLASFRGTRYHLPEYQHGAAASGSKEIFNYLHSSLKNVIERCFAVLKQRWRMLKAVPSYPPRKQASIIIACMALHNFIRDSNLYDYHFARCDADEDYMPPGHVVNTSGGSYAGSSNAAMDTTRDRIADDLMAARE